MSDAEWDTATAADMRTHQKVYDDLERRMDARFALVCSVLANCNRDPKTKRTPYKVDDFMPRRAPQTRDELVAKIRLMCGSLKPVS